MSADTYKVGPFEFASRLFVGTGKYADFDLMKASLDASGCQVVTVAIRRDVLAADGQAKPGNILAYLDPERYTILPSQRLKLPRI